MSKVGEVITPEKVHDLIMEVKVFKATLPMVLFAIRHGLSVVKAYQPYGLGAGLALRAQS